MRALLRNVAGGLVASVALTFALSHAVQAFSSHYFDDADALEKTGVTGQYDVALVAGKGKYTVDATVNVYVYFDSPAGVITINNYDYCDSVSNKYSDQQDTATVGWIPADNRNMTAYTITTGSGSQTVYGQSRKYANSTCGRGDISIPVSNLSYNNDVGKYYAKFVAASVSTDVNGSLNFFSLDAWNANGTTTGVIIAHAGGTTGREVTVEQRSGHSELGKRNQDFLDYRIKFGSDCTILENTTRSLAIYDLDNLGDTGTTTPNTQMYETITVSLYRADGTAVNIWGTNGNGVPFSGTSFTPRDGGNDTIYINFTAEPKTSYYLEMRDVFSNNTIQYGTPFDGIYHDVQCPSVDLYPKATVNTDVILPGDSVSVKQEIINNNDASAYRESPYAVYEYVIKKGKTKPTPTQVETVFEKVDNVRTVSVRYAEATISSTACDWLRGKAGFGGIEPGCKLVDGGNREFNSPINLLNTGPIMADDYSPGDLVCRIISVGYYNRDSGDNDRRISVPVCVILAKRPNVHVWGNDLRVGDSIYAAGTLNGVNNNVSVRTKYATLGVAPVEKTHGSWAEYGIFAPSNGIINAVSGGAVAGVDGFAGEPTLNDISQESFANIAVAEPGHWSSARQLNSFLGAVSATAIAETRASSTSSAFPLNSVSIPAGDTQRVVFTGSGTIDLKHEYRGTGSLIIQAENSTVTISTNLTKDIQQYSSIGSATQVVIIARNIIIESDVEQIDAWLIALPNSATDAGGGIISTCGSAQTPYYQGLKVGGECDQHKLQINGAVVAKELQLRRTFGATKDNYHVPAEVINLRAEGYMWGNRLNATTPGAGLPIDTVFTKELPPRF